MSEEVELIVESLLGVLLRTILEISNRPQPAGPAMRLQFQDVTVCVRWSLFALTKVNSFGSSLNVQE